MRHRQQQQQQQQQLQHEQMQEATGAAFERYWPMAITDSGYLIGYAIIFPVSCTPEFLR